MKKMCICGKVMIEQLPDPNRPGWTIWLCPAGHEMGYRADDDIHEAAVYLTARMMQADDPDKLLDRILQSDGPLPDADDIDGWKRWLEENQQDV